MRSDCRSRNPCTEPSRPVLSGSTILPASNVLARRRSSQAPTRTMMLPRIASSPAIDSSAKPMISVSSSKVSVDRLDST